MMGRGDDSGLSVEHVLHEGDDTIPAADDSGQSMEHVFHGDEKVERSSWPFLPHFIPSHPIPTKEVVEVVVGRERPLGTRAAVQALW